MNALSAAHVVALTWVQYHPGAAVAAIADGLGADADDVAAVCDELEDVGLIANWLSVRQGAS